MLNSKRLVWRRCHDSQRGTALFRRPLSVTELKFYWDSVFSDSSMTIEHLVLDAPAELEKEVFSKENIELAWIRTKQRFPLLATTVDELPGSEIVEFVLDETALCSIRAGEVNFIDNQDSIRLTNELLNGPSILTNEITAKLWIVRQKDVPRRYHALITTAPYIADRTPGVTLTPGFCQELSSLSKHDRFEGELLAKRLSGSLPVEVLHHSISLSLSQSRWRSAAAKIINKLRQEGRMGGHTLPILRPVDLTRPASTRTMSLRLPAYASRAVVSTCRSNCISFDSALPILSQLALSRVLHRHRNTNNAEYQRRSVINGEECEYRLLHPMRYAIPLRSIDHHEWYKVGGVAGVGFAVGFHEVVLPPMAIPKVLYPEPQSYPLQNNIQSLARWLEGPRDVNAFLSDGPIDPGDPYETDGIGDDAHYSKATFKRDGLPSFSSLLSQQLFLAQARMIHKQLAVQLSHPLLHDLHAERMLELSRRARARGLVWRDKQASQSKVEHIFSEAQNMFSEQGERILIDSESIFGDRDEPFPTDYPMSSSSSHPSPTRLRVVESEKYLRCLPGHMYLGMRIMREELIFTMCTDANVVDPILVREWLDEVGAATVHYLAGGNWDNDYGARLPARL